MVRIGIVGKTNVGKTTFFNAATLLNAKISTYPFTTKSPAYGMGYVQTPCVCKEFGVKDKPKNSACIEGWRFIPVEIMDLPGLIEGAHLGKGLGHEFLRHIERTRLMVHLLDGGSADPWEDMQTVNEELREYGQGLEDRPQIVVVNKIDIPEVAERRRELEKGFRKHALAPHFMSAATGEGVREVMEEAAIRLKEMREAEPVPQEVKALPVLRPQERGIRVRQEDGAYRVEEERSITFAEMMPIETEEGRAEVWRRFQRWGVTGALRRAGAQRGDIVRLGRVELEMEA